VNLILIEPVELSSTAEVTLSGPRAAHLLDVLGVRLRDQVRIGVVDGARGTGTVVGIDANRTVTLACEFEPGIPPAPPVDLLLAMPRPKVMRRLWAQLAALGVGRILLTNAERVERNYFDTHVLSPSVYRPLLIEGLQQARDTRVPVVTIHRRLKVLVEDDLNVLCLADRRIVADSDARTPVAALMAQHTTGRVLLAVGPEGGWNGFETRLLVSNGFQPAGMGPRTLRTDTACVALLALVHAAIDQQMREK
jgi:16S rRNA (uracil1498-N3)-methyltransferase